MAVLGKERVEEDAKLKAYSNAYLHIFSLLRSNLHNASEHVLRSKGTRLANKGTRLVKQGGAFS